MKQMEEIEDTHEEIQKILEFSDQRLKTSFLILASTGIRVGALRTLRVGDLEKIDEIYKVRVYSGDKEEYITFTTIESAKEIVTESNRDMINSLLV